MEKETKEVTNGKSSIFFTDTQIPSSYSLSNQFAENLEFRLVRDRITATGEDAYFALSLAIRDRLVRKWLRTQHEYIEKDVKRVYYLSLEYMMGRLLGNALINMDFYNECYEILKEDGYSLEEIREFEHDMGLGNGGLGRLAACYLDSMATLELPAFGYGIRYEYGIFDQEIENGFQIEYPDNWLQSGNPWDIPRRDLQYRVKFYGKSNRTQNPDGTYKFEWIETEDVLALAYDVPVPGYKNNTVNNLRLWQAKAGKDFSFKDFNAGNYVAAVASKTDSETISKVLYPNDSYVEGKFLRLKQQYFFVSATLQDIIRKYKINHDNFEKFSDKISIQLNDTHPVISIPELMRILIDEENLSWAKAWEITTKTFAYTNHTVVPEALEEWSLSLFEELLPRHTQIVFEINRRFVDHLKKNYTKDEKILSKLSIINEKDGKAVRMANLAIVGSFAVNGVAALHTEILKTRIFSHFHKIYPNKFLNVTNGITPRRWLREANPFLSKIITEKIGDSWLKNLDNLKLLEKHIGSKNFYESWRSAKWFNKKMLVNYIESENGITVNPDSMFDVQIKRFHEYKRQLLNIFHLITLYNRIKDNPSIEMVPRTVIFGGKAAPAYFMAKVIIKLINSVAKVVNNDPDVDNKLKVVFIRNYSVTLAEKIIPASDLSEQISMAGLEASGTGNMKFALNGALTIGTMDGANIEIREEVGDENIFIFGLLADEVLKLRNDGYNPEEYYEKNENLKRIIDMIGSDFFNKKESGIFKPVIDELLNKDYYCLLADYQSYIDTQDKVSKLYENVDEWTTKSILNVARVGKFSSDRSIGEYAEKIWKVKPVKIQSS
ncbi:MAG: glycogen/starch/alpha-glucan phosphorylase [Ignavibacteria bacterium]|nr:glycogen/starch/alpha-glucan phosphorylase [Ignavibacteria bacterium]MBT8381022.1 glycogen/starch/alpha-glucan phosphorylase [Ignavibacteria bacterium]MBT8390522.1 glycogen/starch/alpha-glucan phosphorylase [Ignavibacteria bacterium]NNJ51783.1 glycogen/starch/alpha-glucan phosphorylase [Ignavibacteriaceae bacterium]NNL22791.1 glycogen/starch/alpha-glucan phosphorylase [Ignavibacteriaceae bacterium]